MVVTIRHPPTHPPATNHRHPCALAATQRPPPLVRSADWQPRARGPARVKDRPNPTAVVCDAAMSGDRHPQPQGRRAQALRMPAALFLPDRQTHTCPYTRPPPPLPPGTLNPALCPTRHVRCGISITHPPTHPSPQHAHAHATQLPPSSPSPFTLPPPRSSLHPPPLPLTS